MLSIIHLGGSSHGTEGHVRACDILVASWAAQIIPASRLFISGDSSVQ